MRREFWDVIWDLPDDEQGNVKHVAEHGLTEDEVEDVLLNADLLVESSASSGQPLRQGWTSTGRYIVVVWEQIDADTVMPITAYEPTEQ
jgi:hypothetical protein